MKGLDAILGPGGRAHLDQLEARVRALDTVVSAYTAAIVQLANSGNNYYQNLALAMALGTSPPTPDLALDVATFVGTLEPRVAAMEAASATFRAARGAAANYAALAASNPSM